MFIDLKISTGLIRFIDAIHSSTLLDVHLCIGWNTEQSTIRGTIMVR